MLRSIALVSSVWLSAATAFAQAPGFPQAPPVASPGVGWTHFTEPSEGAYTLDVPQGWRVAGGVRRYAASEAPAWVTAESPDRSIEVFLGDPSLNVFTLPSQFFAEGAQVPGLHNRASTVMRYRPGAEYAELYGTRSLGAICSNVRLQDTHLLPALEDEMRQKVQNATRLDAGQANFICERNGQPTAAGVLAGTGLILFPGGNGAGFWAVAALRGFIAPASQAAQAEQVLTTMSASFKPDPQFIAAIQQAGAQEEERARLQNQQRAQTPPPMPAPMPIPGSNGSYGQRPVANTCDDLQQQRICAINDGHLVVSGGCLKCVQ